MKKILISFGSDGYDNTLKQLKNSAINYFDDIILYGISDILNLKESHPEHFINGRGYGYWIWKPYLILKTLNLMSNNDILCYTDATMTFIDDPINLLKILENKSIILFGSDYTNSQFTKFDTFLDLKLLDIKYIEGTHVNASMIIVKKNDFTINFFTEYLNVCGNYHIISDETNISGMNFPNFISHRHDQSILSLLSIKYNIELYRDPTQWGETQKKLFTNSNYSTILNHHRVKL